MNGSCYCGAVKYHVPSTAEPIVSLYCHCESCRRAHAAPVYHCVYMNEEDMVFQSGKELLTNFRLTDEEGSPTRAFCSVCGTRMQNKLNNKPWFGFFPTTLHSDHQQNLPSVFQPTIHYCGHEAVVDLKSFHPELPVVGPAPLPASSPTTNISD